MKKVYLAAPFFNELELKNMWYVADNQIMMFIFHKN